MNRHHYLLVDTETTIKQTVADFGAVVMTKQGKIVEQFGALINGHFGTLPLFSNPTAKPEDFWSTQMAHRRRKHYDALLDQGQRSICSPTLVNLWLSRILGQYNPVVTAYNLSFDLGKCANTGIDLGIFSQRFCSMKVAKKIIGIRADYQQFCFDQNLLTAKKRKPQMTADAMAKFVVGEDLPDEPHTALEDARDYEAPILASILKKVSRTNLLEIGQ